MTLSRHESPSVCPLVSFTVLKLSRSTTTRAKVRCCLRTFCASFNRSSLLGSEVRESVCCEGESDSSSFALDEHSASSLSVGRTYSEPVPACTSPFARKTRIARDNSLTVTLRYWASQGSTAHTSLISSTVIKPNVYAFPATT